MKHDITGLDKANLLVALYNNAKNSAWTKATLRSRPFSNMKQTELTKEIALEILDEGSLVQYVGAVFIYISFFNNIIDTECYDREHYNKGNAKSAQDVIALMRDEMTSQFVQHPSGF